MGGGGPVNLRNKLQKEENLAGTRIASFKVLTLLPMNVLIIRLLSFKTICLLYIQIQTLPICISDDIWWCIMYTRGVQKRWKFLLTCFSSSNISKQFVSQHWMNGCDCCGPDGRLDTKMAKKLFKNKRKLKTCLNFF